jgi:hypothetical protein
MSVVETTPRPSHQSSGGDTSPLGKAVAGAVTGVLVGFADNGQTPLVVYPGQRGTAAVAARTVADVQGAHIGKDVVLVFEDGDPGRPVIIGCVRQAEPTLPLRPSTVEVDVDGERLVVSAQQQLVLRCGAASITMTSSGKIVIQGTYVSSRSAGVNRVKGGSVQIN